MWCMLCKLEATSCYTFIFYESLLLQYPEISESWIAVQIFPSGILDETALTARYRDGFSGALNPMCLNVSKLFHWCNWCKPD